MVIITINSMVSGITGALMLQKTQRSLMDATNQLTSGKRINSAADDAAGLAIATRFASESRTNSAAICNANDGISLLQIAVGI